MTAAMHLRPANPSDLELLRHWDEQPHTIASDPNDDWNWEVELTRTPVWREQLIAELDGRSLGFIQIIDPALEDSHYWGDIGPGFRAIDIWIGEASDLGKGYGTQMMKLALARCFAPPEVSAVLIDPAGKQRAVAPLLRAPGFPVRRTPAVWRGRLLRLSAESRRIRVGGRCERSRLNIVRMKGVIAPCIWRLPPRAADFCEPVPLVTAACVVNCITTAVLPLKPAHGDDGL